MTREERVLTAPEKEFVKAVMKELQSGERRTRPQIRKIANGLGIEDKTQIKELSELAIVNQARALAHQKKPIHDRYVDIVNLYERQVNLSFRTSQSILLQQYSTPAPIAFLMGVFAEIDQGKSVFEPSAGNGLLTIAAQPKYVTVNEVDPMRQRTLYAQHFKAYHADDARDEFYSFARRFEAVLTNPPFGRLPEPIRYTSSAGDYKITELDHAMTINALETMKVNGKAAIIIGGHTKWDERGRIQRGKNRIFFNYLYAHYNVLDVIAINGSKLYSRQGTSFDTRLILIDGVNTSKEGVAPLKTAKTATVMHSFDALYERMMESVDTKKRLEQKRIAWYLQARGVKRLLTDTTLGAPYLPTSDACVVLDTEVPDTMSFEMHEALRLVEKAVGGDVDNFVRHRLGYFTKTELCAALSAEQIDAVALAIYNIEAKGQSVIVGDQTGIGKGRVAASIIRYAVRQGVTPIFLTEKANLFSDLYRDLNAIGSGHLNPFIINKKDSKTHIKDEFGNVLYTALSESEQQQIFKDKAIPNGFDLLVATYSQFNSPQKRATKPNYLKGIADQVIFIMDESHNASGASNTGEFMQQVVDQSKGAVFLSATFAKRPDNMPLYAMKTAMKDANMDKEDLVEAIINGGVALQEIISSQLVAEGQMIRRERTYKGVEVNYHTLTDLASEHKRIADGITEIIRRIIGFQTIHINRRVDELDAIAAREGKEIEKTAGTNNAGVDNLPYFSKVFNIINQMLFSIKADAVAERAIAQLKEGRKPIIAFSSTMGSFLEQIENAEGESATVGDTIRADFAVVLERGLQGVLKYTETSPTGQKKYHSFDPEELSMDARVNYQEVMGKIQTVSTGITISPIDVILQKIQRAGYSVAEVTGRKWQLQLDENGNTGLIQKRPPVNTHDAFRGFNDNEIDVLLINQSGSTGASAHAIVTEKVPEHKVKQRVMIVLQPELNINTEVQKRGRIHRTGQILKPRYDYVTSAIPAEQRLMMMLQKKLKSLDANTSSNQKQSNDILNVPDFLNKYGDQLILDYLTGNPEINDLLGDPLNIFGEKKKKVIIENAAHKVSGRVAILSTKMQTEFYRTITTLYKRKIDYLKQSGEYDLEVEELDLKAKTISQRTVKVGKGGSSNFGQDSVLETVEVNILRKPFSVAELREKVQASLGDQSYGEIQSELLRRFESSNTQLLNESIQTIEARYQMQIRGISSEKKVQRLSGEEQRALIQERESVLREEMTQRIGEERKKFENKSTHIRGMFKFFHVGRKLNYPVKVFGQEPVNQLAVFLGFRIDFSKKNPFAPSAIELRFALANSQKYVVIPGSLSIDINAIKGASFDIQQGSLVKTLADWEERITENSKDRGIRYIVTGNLLQAFGAFKGKLVSYTTFDDKIKKGILMSDHWFPDPEESKHVSIPIAKGLRIIQSMQLDGGVTTSGNLTLIKKSYDHYKVIVPQSKKAGGQFFLDDELRELVNKGLFESVSNQMVGILPSENLPQFIAVLQRNHNLSMLVAASTVEAQGLDEMRISESKKITLPPPELKKTRLEIYLLQTKAKAAKLALQLAA